MTVKGPVNPDSITGVYAHEHLAIDLQHVRKDVDSTYGDVRLMIEELQVAKRNGINLFVDMTNSVMGRNVRVLKQLSVEMDIHIMASTGLYIEEYLHEYKSKTTEEIASIFLHEIEDGLDGTNIRPGVIGEIGVSGGGPTETEHKSLMAAAIASKKTGLAVSVHTPLGKHGLEAAKILIKEGVEPDKIIIGHMDLSEDTTEAEAIITMGANIGFDTIGKDGYVPNETRLRSLVKLIKLGHVKKIVISQDISRKSYMKKYGGHGYGYIHESFIPKLLPHITAEALQSLIRDNAVRILSLDLGD